MNFVRCETLELYFSKLGTDINNRDMIFVEDSKEIYTDGKPYGKDINWIEPPKPEIGDYYTKTGGLIRFSELTDDDKDNLAGIYVGDHPETGDKLLIPANAGFAYNSTQGGLKWCNDYPIPTDIQNSINPSDVTTNSTEARTKFNGKSQTDKILAAANSKPATYFGEANFCKSFAPGFKDGEWYLPSVGELLLINKSYSTILQSVTKVFSAITLLAYYWSSNQYSARDSWRVNLDSGTVDDRYVSYSSSDVVPFLAIK